MQNENGRNAEQEKVHRQRRMQEELQKLRSHATSFEFLLVGTGRWTMPEAKELALALSANKSVVDLMLNLHACSISAVPLFSNYIRASRNLHRISVCYCPTITSRRHGRFIQQEYREYMRVILPDIVQNPNIKELNMYRFVNCPKEIFDLLSQTTTLTTFEFDADAVTREMAVALQGGLRNNKSLQKVSLSVQDGPHLDVAMKGLVLAAAASPSSASKITSLLVGHGNPNAKFFDTLSKILHVTPTIETLEVGHVDLVPGGGGLDDDDDATASWCDQVFWDFRRPVCASMTKAILREVRLEGASAVMNVADFQSMQNPNNTLQVLELYNVKFATRKSVRLLWNLIGLRELTIYDPTFCHHMIALQEDYDAEQEDSPKDMMMDDDDDDDEQHPPDAWEQVFKRNKYLKKLSLRSEWDSSGFIIGLQEMIRGGVCGHATLEILTLEICAPGTVGGEGRVDRRVGTTLCKLLQETKSLQKVTLKGTNVLLEGAMMLSQGIYGSQSSSLEYFSLDQSDDDCGFISLSALTILLGSLRMNNTTLKTFKAYADTPFDVNAIDEQTFFWTLAGVFRFNKTLESFKLPIMDINGSSNMDVLLGALFDNDTMKLLDFSACSLDQHAWNSLVKALTGETPNSTRNHYNNHNKSLSISSIGLPCARSSDATKLFLRNLERMSCIQKVSVMWGISSPLDAQECTLLLQAVQRKKTLCSFERRRNPANDALDTEIDYYLKLNRFGRRVFDCHNTVVQSLWPTILSRPARDPNDVDALFFFLNAQFPSYHKSINPTSPTSPTSSPPSPSSPLQPQPLPRQAAQIEPIQPCSYTSKKKQLVALHKCLKTKKEGELPRLANNLFASPELVKAKQEVLKLATASNGATMLYKAPKWSSSNSTITALTGTASNTSKNVFVVTPPRKVNDSTIVSIDIGNNVNVPRFLFRAGAIAEQAIKAAEAEAVVVTPLMDREENHQRQERLASFWERFRRSGRPNLYDLHLAMMLAALVALVHLVLEMTPSVNNPVMDITSPQSDQCRASMDL